MGESFKLRHMMGTGIWGADVRDMTLLARLESIFICGAVGPRQPCLTRLPQQNSSSLILVFERPPFAAARPLQVAAHESGKRRAMHQLHLGMRDNNGHYKETLLSFKTN